MVKASIQIHQYQAWKQKCFGVKSDMPCPTTLQQVKDRDKTFTLYCILRIMIEKRIEETHDKFWNLIRMCVFP